jgi:hypothetical protein
MCMPLFFMYQYHTSVTVYQRAGEQGIDFHAGLTGYSIIPIADFSIFDILCYHNTIMVD